MGMARDKWDGVEFLYINSSYLNILEDEAWDRITSVETNTGKRRREIENVIVQANIELYEYIVLSSIRYFLARIKEKSNMLAKEMMDKNKSDEMIKIFYHEYNLLEVKRLALIKELEKIKNILLEKINQSNIAILKLDKLIDQKSDEIKKLDERYVYLDNDNKNIYNKNYDAVLAQPISVVPCTTIIPALIAELNLPDDHPLRNAPEISPYDIRSLVIKLQEEMKRLEYDMSHHAEHERNLVEEDLDNRILEESLQPCISKEECIHYINQAKKLLEYKHKVEQTLKAIHAGMTDSDFKHIDDIQTEQTRNRQEKNIKAIEKSQLEKERDVEYLRKDLCENQSQDINTLIEKAAQLLQDNDLLSMLQNQKPILDQVKPPPSTSSRGLFAHDVKHTVPHSQDKTRIRSE